MAHLLVRHKVQDFGKWKAVYEAHVGARQAAGLIERQLWRNADHPNEVLLLFEASDLGKAHAFASSADLRQAMQRAGVTDQPDVYFLT